MNKKNIILPLSLAVTFTFACGLSACNLFHRTHVWDDGQIIVEPACEKTGVRLFTCTECSETKTEEIAAMGHDLVRHEGKAPTCTEMGWNAYDSCSRCAYTTYVELPATGHPFEWGADEIYHWKVFTCEHVDQPEEKTLHTFGDDNTCTVCDYQIVDTPDKYFTFTLQDDDTYEICAKDNTNFPQIVFLPETFEGKPVTSIGRNAFSYCMSLTSITISDSITNIGDNAFADCRSLTSITIPTNVTKIGGRVFQNCPKLERIQVEENNPVYHSFGNCIIETESKTLIVGCKNTVPPTDGSVTSIETSAFHGCSDLTSIIIPASVTSIRLGAFMTCNNLQTVYYFGTPDDWNNIHIDVWNSILPNASPYYYSETEPTEEGKYWHYVDGVPTVW